VTWTTSDRIMAVRHRSAFVDVAVETVDGWRRHLTGRNAAVLTYYGFLSVFPLFLVATSILSFVLEGNPELQDEILDTAVSQIPVIGTTIEQNAGELDTSSVWALVIGLLIALWAATRAFVGLQLALDDAWDVHVDRRDSFLLKRAKALLGIGIIASAQIGATALSSIASLGDFPAVNRVLLVLGTLALNTGVLAAMFRFLSARDVTWRMAWPGALLGGIGFTALQIVGATVVNRYLRRAEDVSGVFATVFALFAWMNLHAFLSLAGAELNAALERRRKRMSVPVEALVASIDGPRGLD
jgi:membrane protein